ncbi:DUF3489 domain-containing protein [Polynucleobacter sp. JS-Safj-400b-B2]|uniref:DUF3489 domain-containing protein n=1 Tax=Polynucleobacter sp. JS-Safj-400b-B2 TaxID=2576921 RepID=UPI00351D84F6
MVGKDSSKRKPTTKHELIVTLLENQGASIADLVKATGWQAHSVRGFISGTIKKKLQLALTSQKQNGIHTYRIAKQK